MNKQVLIAGGGIGGLAAALACARSGAEVRLFERAAEFAEVGAGIQLGPNVTRVLQGWGLDAALRNVAAFPQRLQIRHAFSGAELGALRLGETMVQRYGAPYATIHRADLHGVLLEAVRTQADARLYLNSQVTSLRQDDEGVTLHMADDRLVEGDLLVGADGLWSRVRELLLADGAPRVTGHLAYRAMVPQLSLPERLRCTQVTVWMGPKLHVVQYPVRGGDWLNVVAIMHGRRDDVEVNNWDNLANVAELRAALAGACAGLLDLIAAIGSWRLWVLCDRPPMRGPQEQARGLVALLGDAAHPMRPYMAQGAGMAIEDADELGRVLATDGLTVPEALQRYAVQRWQRNARVQARSIRNGEIFHASGLMGWARNVSLRMLGETLLDVPWLYAGP
jgi:salicylate hydroxylase